MKTAIAMLSMLLVSAGAFAHDDMPLTDIPLVWAPSNSIADMDDPKPNLTPIIDVKLQIDQFTDGRQDHAAIGENRKDATPKPVTTKDDVGKWVSDGLRTELGKAGLSVVPSGGTVILGGEVRQLFSTEANTYGTDVTLKLTARNSAGKVIWSGVVTGHDTHWGRTYRASEYYQNLSDGVMDALHSLLTNKDFIDAVAKG